MASCLSFSQSFINNAILQEEYNLKENNFEHLITIATIGIPFSVQVEKPIFYALQCSKFVVRSCRGSLAGQASNCCINNCCPGDIAAQAITAGVGDTAQQIGNVIATNTPTVAAEAGAALTTKSAAKASIKTSSKAAFEVGSEAAINGTCNSRSNWWCGIWHECTARNSILYQRCLQTRP